MPSIGSRTTVTLLNLLLGACAVSWVVLGTVEVMVPIDWRVGLHIYVLSALVTITLASVAARTVGQLRDDSSLLPHRLDSITSHQLEANALLEDITGEIKTPRTSGGQPAPGLASLCAEMAAMRKQLGMLTKQTDGYADGYLDGLTSRPRNK